MGKTEGKSACGLQKQCPTGWGRKCKCWVGRLKPIG